MSDLYMHGPVKVELKVHITDGKRQGVATISAGVGRYPSAERLQEIVHRFVADEIPAGFRLMTKREFWDTAVMPPRPVEDDDGGVYLQHYAMPGGDEFDPLEQHASASMRGLDTNERVRFYEHDFYVLSNFSAFNLEWDGITFPTSEHAYHWEKFANEDGFNEANEAAADIMAAPSAHEAFKIAERNREHRRPDWDAVKVEVMSRILRAKAEQHEYVRRKLLATGERELVEDSWRDDFWGWGPSRAGQNMLGKLWMEVRADLRSGAAPTVSELPGQPADEVSLRDLSATKRG